MECWECIYGAFCLDAELKFRIFTIDIEVWREQPEGRTNSIWIWYDHLKSIVCVLAIRLVRTSFVSLVKSRSCTDFNEIVCRFRSERSSRDRVSISLRSCVNFAKYSLEFGSDLKNLHRGGEL